MPLRSSTTFLACASSLSRLTLCSVLTLSGFADATGADSRSAARTDVVVISALRIAFSIGLYTATLKPYRHHSYPPAASDTLRRPSVRDDSSPDVSILRSHVWP